MFLALAVCAPLEAAPRVTMNGRDIQFDVDPFIEKDRVMVPMRGIFEALGAVVEWNPETRSVTARYGNDTVFLAIGSRTAFRYKNGSGNKPVAVELEVAPMIVGERTMVPVRFVSESLNARVEWVDSNKTVNIIKEN